MPAFCDIVDGFKVLDTQFDRLEITHDPGWCRTLWQYDIASAETPGNQYLCERIASFLRNGIQSGVGINLLPGGGNLVLRTKW